MPLDYAIHRRTLPNGLRVLIQPDHRVPTVAVNVWVGVGSRHESPGRTGFAHLFEHLMFQGSANVASGEHFSALMGVGGRLNATTWFDRTNYFETVPTGALELALWLEADRHGNLLPALTQDNLDNQRDVVKEEKRQRYDNQPYGTALIDVYAALFPEGHPYHHPTIGSMEDLDAATLDDVHAFFRAHYGPDNTVLTLVGDVEPEQGFALAERYFGPLPPTGLQRRAPLPPLDPLHAPVRIERVEDVPNDRVYLAFRLPVDGSEQFRAASIALDCIAGLMISPLEQHLVRGEQLATSVHTSAMGFVDGVSLGLIVADVAEGVEADLVERRICDALTAMATDGPSAVMMEAVRAGSERAWLSALAAHEDRADQISRHEMLLGGGERVNTFLDEIASVTADEVRRATARWLDPSSRAVVTYRASAEDEAAA